jgi:carboxymethylenebutenolidase
MKKLLFLLLISANTFAQTCCDTKTACKKDESMAVFASNKDFIAAHLSPLPYIHISEVGLMTSFETPDKSRASAYILKAKVKTNKYLFVYQEWWGLNEHIKKQAEKFYDDLDGQVNVLAMDMYDGQIATKPEEAGKLMQGAKEDRLAAIMKGAIKFAGKKAKITSVGWCFGGGLSLKSAILAQKKAVGCVMYYGMPVKDVEQLKTLQCDVLGLFAGREKWISPKVVAEFEENMKTANKAIKTKIFDAEHAFANPSNPNYDKLMAADAYELAITYIRDRLRD